MARFLRLSFITIISILTVSCSSAQSLPQKEPLLVAYKSPYIVGYEGKPIIVNRAFLPSMYRIDHYAKTYCVVLYVTNSFRKQGDNLSGAIVSPARRSNHLVGHAIDMNVMYNNTLYTSKELRKSNLDNLPANVRNFINAVRNDKSLRWGGDFSQEDPIHIDDGLNVNNPNAWNHSFSACQNAVFQNQL